MGSLILGLAALAEQVMIFVNTENSRKYGDEIKEIKLQMLAEEEKGYHSDDAKIEHLHKKLKIVVEAADAEFKRYLAQAK